MCPHPRPRLRPRDRPCGARCALPAGPSPATPGNRRVTESPSKAGCVCGRLDGIAQEAEAAPDLEALAVLPASVSPSCLSEPLLPL